MRDAEGVRFLQWCLPTLRLRWRGFRRVRRQVYRGIERRRAQLGLSDLAAYRAYLEGHEEEWAVLDTLCRIPISRFYRDRAAFRHLELVVLPELTRMLVDRGDDELRAWSIGCASGEEPYTLAIIWRLVVAPAFPRVRFRVLGTDTDREAIERAERGAYPAHGVRDLPPEMLTRAFTESPAGFVLREDCRVGVEFLEQDVRVTTPGGPFHLILCRNIVFTYFDAELQRRTLRRILERLVPGGALMIGATESLPVDGAWLEPWSERFKVYRAPSSLRSSSAPCWDRGAQGVGEQRRNG